jgi:hypothetical protein
MKGEVNYYVNMKTSSELLCHIVCWKFTDISEVLAASIITATIQKAATSYSPL